jgi:hypothetical protein
MNMRWVGLGLIMIGAIAGSTVIALPMGIAGASKSSSQNFCVPMKVVIEELQQPVLNVTAPRAPILARTLKRTAKNAPKAVARSMKQMASTYALVAKPGTDANRARALFQRAAEFPAQAKVVADYYSAHCVAAPVSSPPFGPVSKANQAACIADVGVLETAETEYSTLNSSFATVTQLVASGLLKTPSVYHPEITVGTPPGGYTIVGNQGCANAAVAG